MNTYIRTAGLIALSVFAIMLLEQCCTCGDRIDPATVEEATEDETALEDDADTETSDTAATATTADDAAKPAAEKKVAAAKQRPLSITITDLKSATAPVIFSVYDNPDTYLDPKAQLRTYRFVPKGNTLKIKLTDLKFGTYAIAFYQDMNDSGAIDKNGLGIPKEPYAFSNDIRPKMSAPSFADCEFVYSKSANAIKVKMGK